MTFYAGSGTGLAILGTPVRGDCGTWVVRVTCSECKAARILGFEGWSAVMCPGCKIELVRDAWGPMLPSDAKSKDV